MDRKEELVQMPLAGNKMNLQGSESNVGWLRSGELGVQYYEVKLECKIKVS